MKDGLYEAIVIELRRRKSDPPAGRTIGGEVYEWCPFHPDGCGKPPHSPSLRLNHDKEVWYCDPCNEGGTLTGLAERLGLRVNAGHKDRIVAVYDYLDAMGDLWGQVCRKANKDFKVRRPDGNGGWTWNWKGVTRTLYRFPELFAADPDEWVFVVEGEKDADRLASLGLVATTNPGGAGKWRDEYSDSLEGRRVAVIPDHDDAGLRHVQQVAASLAGKAADVRIVELPAMEIGDDVSDFLDRGGNAEALVAKAEAAERNVSPAPKDGGAGETKFVTASDFTTRTPGTAPWLVRPWVVRGGITMVSGKPKLAGKTTWTLHLVKAVLEGGQFLGETAMKGSVIYLTEERTSSFVDALRRTGLGERGDLIIRQYRPEDAWADVVRETMAEARRVGAVLIVVDTLPVFAGLPGDNENAAGHAREALDPITQLDDLALVVEFHDRKSGGDPGDSTRGSSAFAGAVDIIVDLKRVGGNGNERRREIAAVGRFEDTPDQTIIELHDDGYHLLGDMAAALRENARALIRTALEGQSMTEWELGEELEGRVKKTTLGAVLRDLVEADEVARDGEGKKGSPYRYFLSPNAPISKAGETNDSDSSQGCGASPDNGVKPTDGPLVRYAVEQLGLPTVGRTRWK